MLQTTMYSIRLCNTGPLKSYLQKTTLSPAIVCNHDISESFPFPQSSQNHLTSCETFPILCQLYSFHTETLIKSLQHIVNYIKFFLTLQFDNSCNLQFFGRLQNFLIFCSHWWQKLLISWLYHLILFIFFLVENCTASYRPFLSKETPTAERR